MAALLAIRIAGPNQLPAQQLAAPGNFEALRAVRTVFEAISLGHLVAQSTLEKLIGAPGATLRRVSEDTFSPDGIAPMIVFERDGTGRVVGYVQQAPDGSVARARRAMP